ncbi:MAG: MFS transporter [Sporichthyaceae bacterium]
MPAPQQDATSASLWRAPAFLAACLGYFMVILDTTIANVALPAIGEDLDADVAALQWVVDSYLVVLAAGILTGGALSDRWTPTVVFRRGIALFTLASLACGLAPTTEVLIGARLAQGAGAALCVPASLAMVRASATDAAGRRRAVGAWAAIAGIAAGAGPLVGGLGVWAWSWRSVFFVNVPIGIVVLLMTRRQELRAAGVPRRLDLPGQALGILALGALALAVIDGAHAGLGPTVLLAAAAAVVLSAAFLAVERRRAEPMLPLELFRSGTFAGGTAIGWLINFSFYGLLFVLNLYFQQARGAGALEAGLAVLPQLGVIVFGASLSARFSQRAAGPRGTALIGLALCAIGPAVLAVAVGLTEHYAAFVLPLMATGFGMGLVMPAVTAALTDAAPAHHAGLAAGVITSARQAGSVVGVAALGGIVAAMGAGLDSLRWSLIVSAWGFVAAHAIAAACLPRRATDLAEAPPAPDVVAPAF